MSRILQGDILAQARLKFFISEFIFLQQFLKITFFWLSDLWLSFEQTDFKMQGGSWQERGLCQGLNGAKKIPYQMVSSPNKFSLILNLTSDLQRKDSQKREGSGHQERKTGTLVAFQRIEQRKLKSESSVGFRGLVEVRFLPFCSVSSSADAQGPLSSHRQLLFWPDVYSGSSALTKLAPLIPSSLYSLECAAVLVGPYYALQVPVSALSMSPASPIQAVSLECLALDRLSKLDGSWVINSYFFLL